MQQFYSFVLVALLVLLVSSCASIKPGDNGADPLLDIPKLQRQLVLKPDDPATLRDLGILYFQTRQYDFARWNLYRSYMQVHDDPRTLFYYGMTLEYMGDSEGALRAYINYTDVSLFSPFRKLLEGRYRTLTHEIVKRQFQTLLADEQKLGTERISPKAVAVFPLAYQGTDKKYEALGLGLSEMILTDLGQVRGLTVIERIRIETLLDELKFGQSGNVDPATAPRLGKLLSAGRIVSGTFNVSNYNLRVDAAAWDIVRRTAPDIKTESDELSNLFKLEKELVFGIIKELGITLSQNERDSILYVPTRNVFAFMNYCLGLKNEAARDYRAARVYYNEAAALDPYFGVAKTKVMTVDAMVFAGGSKEDVLLAAEQVDPTLKKSKKGSQANLIIARLQHLGYGIGNTFTPGQDDRKPAEEAIDLGRLPEPPRPPNN